MLSSNKQQQECFFPTSNPRAKQTSLAYPLRIPCVSLAYPLRISCVFLAWRNFSHYPFFFFFAKLYSHYTSRAKQISKFVEKNLYFIIQGIRAKDTCIYCAFSIPCKGRDTTWYPLYPLFCKEGIQEGIINAQSWLYNYCWNEAFIIFYLYPFFANKN